MKWTKVFTLSVFTVFSVLALFLTFIRFNQFLELRRFHKEFAQYHDIGAVVFDRDESPGFVEERYDKEKVIRLFDQIDSLGIKQYYAYSYLPTTVNGEATPHEYYMNDKFFERWCIYHELEDYERSYIGYPIPQIIGSAYKNQYSIGQTIPGDLKADEKIPEKVIAGYFEPDTTLTTIQDYRVNANKVWLSVYRREQEKEFFTFSDYDLVMSGSIFVPKSEADVPELQRLTDELGFWKGKYISFDKAVKERFYPQYDAKALEFGLFSLADLSIAVGWGVYFYKTGKRKKAKTV